LYDLLWNLLDNPLFTLRYALGRRPVFFGVESILCELESVVCFFTEQRELEKEHILQNDLRILAALSLSLSRVVGQKASDPILFESLLTGAPTVGCQFSFPRQQIRMHSRLSAHCQALSKPFLLPVFVLSQEGRIEVTFCILAVSFKCGSCWCSEAQIQAVRGLFG
jgi:hypothetical protein